MAVITFIVFGQQQFRSSGNAMRNLFYFSTSQGDSTLHVASKKAGIIAQLREM